MADKGKPNGLTLTAVFGDFYSLTSCPVFYTNGKTMSNFFGDNTGIKIAL